MYYVLLFVLRYINKYTERMTKASLQSARNRLQKFPQMFTSCSKEAVVYGQCVTRKYEDVSKDSCVKEFEMFRDCLQKAARNLKVKL